MCSVLQNVNDLVSCVNAGLLNAATWFHNLIQLVTERDEVMCIVVCSGSSVWNVEA